MESIDYINFVLTIILFSISFWLNRRKSANIKIAKETIDITTHSQLGDKKLGVTTYISMRMDIRFLNDGDKMSIVNLISLEIDNKDFKSKKINELYDLSPQSVISETIDVNFYYIGKTTINNINELKALANLENGFKTLHINYHWYNGEKRKRKREKLKINLNWY